MEEPGWERRHVLRGVKAGAVCLLPVTGLLWLMGRLTSGYTLGRCALLGAAFSLLLGLTAVLQVCLVHTELRLARLGFRPNPNSRLARAGRTAGRMAGGLGRMVGLAGRGVAAVCAVALVVVLVRWGQAMGKLGVSLTPADTQVEVSDAYYQAGLDCWAQLDYAGAEENFLLARARVGESQSQGTLEAAEINQKLGALYLDMGRYEQAYELLNSAYVAFRDLLGDSDGRTVTAKCQLHLYDIRTGELERGFAGLNQAYDQTESLGDKLQILQMLAQARMLTGDYRRAMESYQLLQQGYQFLGAADSRVYVVLLSDMAVLSCDLGEYRRAEQLLDEAEMRWGRYGQAQDLDLALVYANRAVVYAALDREEEALAEAGRALALYQALLGEDNLYTAMCLQSMGAVYGTLQQPDRQQACLEQALDTALTAVGEYHNGTAVICASLSDCCADRGDLEGALTYARRALDIRKAILGELSPYTAEVYQRISQLCARSGQGEQAVESALRAIDIREKLAGRDNPAGAQAYLTAAWAWAAQGDYAQAEQYARQGLGLAEQNREESGSVLAYGYETLGYVLTLRGQYAPAEENLQLALEHDLQLYGEGHSAPAEVRLYLGELYLRQEDWSRAEQVLRLARAGYESLPAGEEGLVRALERLGLAFRGQGLHAQALEQFQAALTLRLARAGEAPGETERAALSALLRRLSLEYEALGEEQAAADYGAAAWMALPPGTQDEELTRRAEELQRAAGDSRPLEQWAAERAAAVPGLG